MDDVERLTHEIEGLHEFFVDWFGGRIARDAAVFAARFRVRISPECLLIQPGGETFTAAQFIGAVEKSYGSSPDFRIAIRNVNLRLKMDGGLFLVTYEEWQRNAMNSKPQDNARAASVLFSGPDQGHSFQWRHIHETWLPSSLTPAARFDF